MKVVLLSFSFGEYSAALAGSLARLTDLLTLLPEGEAPDYFLPQLQTIPYRPFIRPRLRQPWRQALMLRHLHQQIHEFAPDVIHLQQGHLWFNLTLPWLRRYPLVVTIHDPRHHVGDIESRKTPQWLMDYGFHCASQLIVHNPQMKQLTKEACGIPEERLHIIPTVARGTHHPQPSAEAEGELQVLFFGRIWAYKGLDYLIRAEPLITAQVPNARIVIAGTGEDFGRYRELMIHPERFRVYNEFIPHDQVNNIFGRAAVVVLPYVEATQSGVVPMAYTFGKPVIATTVGGLPDQVEHERTGLLVPPGDEVALAQAVIDLLKDSERRHRLGEGGRRKAQAEFAADVVARQTVAVYQQALAGASYRSVTA
jgi:glycosyltransferase involved in cell wall biosynthesis